VDRGETVLLLHLGDKPASDDACLRAAGWIEVDDVASVGAASPREMERIDGA
jgi:hypothetical protein